MNYDLASLLISAASFAVSLVAVWIARSSLSQAQRVADRDQRDWKQRKWFDLYFRASEFRDNLDHFQAQHGRMSPNLRGIPGIIRDLNELMFLIRKVHSMAAVFPKDQTIDALIAATAVFRNRDEAFSEERLTKIKDAVEGLRQRALVDTSVLA